MTEERVALVGVGYLGMSVARTLDEPLVAVSRSGVWRDGKAPAHVRMRAADITRACPASALRPARAVVVAVAPGRTQDRYAVYVEGVRKVLEGAAESSLERFVYVSSTSAYADRDGWVDVDDAHEPESERGRVQRDAEREVEETCEARGIPWIVLRLGGLYGPGRPLGRIYRQRSAEPLAGDGWAPTNLIHLEDATAAVLAALQAPSDVTGRFGVVDDDHTPRRAMYARIAEVAGVPPVTWARAVPPGTPPRGKRVSNRRLKTRLGVRLRYPYHLLDDPQRPAMHRSRNPPLRPPQT